ncbi:hypothetical protein, partial [Paenibacillus macerans]|uniref:hypothetical protein n=1 Tax=Paenibacillus macerans TaxID=44252 RepID=UPI003D280F34
RLIFSSFFLFFLLSFFGTFAPALPLLLLLNEGNNRAKAAAGRDTKTRTPRHEHQDTNLLDSLLA